MADESQLIHTHPDPHAVTKDDIAADALSPATTINLADPTPDPSQDLSADPLVEQQNETQTTDDPGA